MKYQTPLTPDQNLKLKDELTDLISTNLKKIRTEKKMTQQELAEKAGLHLTYIGHMEAGKYHPSTFVLWKVANVLEVKLSDLLDS